MFCPKCGTKALDDAEFCQKCGAKLIVDASTGQSAATSRANPPQQSNPSLSNTSEKKKPKLPIVLGSAAALILVLVIMAVIGSVIGSDSSTDSSQPPAGYLTYTNAAEGISFQYPDTLQEGSLSEAGTYFTDDSMTMIVYLLAPTVNGGQTPILDIRKVPATQSVMDEVFSATLSNVAPEGNMIVTEIDDGSIGDIPYRKFTLATKANDGSDITIQRYVYFVNSFQYQIEFSGYTDDMESNEIKSFIDDLIESYTIRTDSSVAPSNSTPVAADQLLFRGTPIQDIIGAHSSDIIAIFGEPKTQSEYSIEYGESYTEDGWMGFYLDDADQVNIFNADPVHFTFEGQSLVQDFDTLVTILGDDYTDVGGTAYYWQVFWNYRDYQIYFSFSRDSDDDKPFSIDVMKSDSETPVDDDDYSWVEGDIDYSEIIDPSLVGRWRSYDGGYVEFSEYGEAAMSFSPYGSVFVPDFITWDASNGRITLSSHFSETSTWEIKNSGSEQMLILSRYNDQRYYRSEVGTSLVGTWNSGAFSGFGDLVLLSDGTGTMNRVISSDPWTMEKVPITWRSDDTNFYVNWTLLSAYDYTVSGNILTIYFSNGSQIYTKVGD